VLRGFRFVLRRLVKTDRPVVHSGRVSLPATAEKYKRQRWQSTNGRKKVQIQENDLTTTIADNIAERLDARGWSVYRLWKSTGGTQPRLYRACRGECTPSVELLRDIAAALETTIDELVAA